MIVPADTAWDKPLKSATRRVQSAEQSGAASFRLAAPLLFNGRMITGRFAAAMICPFRVRSGLV
jgi:phage-related protein